MPRAAAFLDRDGVINRAVVIQGRPHPPRTCDHLTLLPGVEEACRRLKERHVLIVVVTNQPDIARGTASWGEVNAINDHLTELLPIDDVLVCPHDDGHRCGCRKPAPGLILTAARQWGIDLGRSTMVGDRWRDVEAGRAAHLATVFLDRGYDERRPPCPDAVCGELLDAVPFILDRAREAAS